MAVSETQNMMQNGLTLLYTRIKYLSSMPIAVLSAVFSRMAAYIVLIIAARILTPEEFGFFAVLTVVGGIVNGVVSGGDMWINRFSTRRSVEERRPPRPWSLYILISLTLSITAFMVAVAGSALVPAMHDHADTIIIAIGAFCVAGIAETLLALIRASGRITIFFTMRDIIAPIGLLVMLVLLRPSEAFGLFAIFLAVWVAILSVLMIFIIGIARWKIGLAWVRVSLLVPTLKHTALLIFTNLGSRISNYVDILTLLFFVGLTDLGEYRVAAQFAIGFIVVQHFIFLALPHELHDVGNLSDRKYKHSRLRDRQSALIMLALVALIIATAGAEWILGILGTRFVEVANIIRVLFLIRFLELLWGPQHEILVSNGLVHFDVIANLVGVSVWACVFAAVHLWIEPIASAIIATMIGVHSAHAVRAAVLIRHAIFCPRLISFTGFLRTHPGST